MNVVRYLLSEAWFVLFGLALRKNNGLPKRPVEIVTPIMPSVFHA